MVMSDVVNTAIAASSPQRDIAISFVWTGPDKVRVRLNSTPDRRTLHLPLISRQECRFQRAATDSIPAVIDRKRLYWSELSGTVRGFEPRSRGREMLSDGR